MHFARRISLVVLLALLASTFAYVPVGGAATLPAHHPVGTDLELPPQVSANADELTQTDGALQQVAPVTPTMDLALSRLGSFKFADDPIESAVEIVAYDPISQRVFSTSAPSGTVEILDISNPASPAPVGSIDVSNLAAPYGGGAPNSVAVKNGIVAVAVENANKQAPGAVAFYTTMGTPLAIVGVGALPDMLTFTPNGKHVVVANEGEPNDDYTVDPEGSVSIIDLPPDLLSNPTVPNVRTVRFDEFNAGGPRAGELPADVRIFGPNASVAQDLEPEYVAISPDSTTAYVTLQENNAVAVVDLMQGRVAAIAALGYKDHSFSGMQMFPFTNLPDLGTVQGTGQVIKLGGFSGLHYRSTQNGELSFLTHPDRGPVADATDIDSDGQPERPFALPDFNAQVVPFTLNPQTGALALQSPILLRRSDGSTPITGLPNLAPDPNGTPARPLGTADVDEEPRTVLGAIPNAGASTDASGYDYFGADMEGIYEAANGDFWMVDEYRPSVYRFNSTGQLISRIVPAGSNDRGPNVGTETLPEIYSQRWANRGFEALALNPDDGLLYVFIQSPIDNPDVADNANARNSRIIRILAIDPANGLPVDEYVYVLEPEAASDKIGDAVYAGNNEFYVIERDSSAGATSSKKIFKVSLAGATDINGLPVAGTGGNLESLVTEANPTDLSALTAAGVTPVQKELVVDLAEIGYYFTDKPEGLAVLPDNQIALLNDNDFSLGGGLSAGLIDTNPISTVLALINLNERPTNRLDASNEDGGFNLQNWPVRGMYQPDAIATFQVGGQTYLVTANEGDARDYDGFSEEARIGDAAITLDANVFPNANILKQDENLGRLNTTTTQGDTDNDGDYDQLYAYGARSFSVWNSSGQLVWDSGDQFARITSAISPTTYDDGRSDDKGTEPEAVVTGKIGDRTFAFIGLERAGGVMVYDVTDPQQPTFVSYAPSMDGDISPEGLDFVSACGSPNGNPLLIIGHEVSNTVTVYEITSSAIDTACSPKLTLLHNNDGESSLQTINEQVDSTTLPVGGVDTFKAVMDREITDARANGHAVASVYAGDAFLASATIQCSFPVTGTTEPVFDAIAQRQMPYDAHALGNHEFDYGPGFLKRFIEGFGGKQPFLSANLDFSNQPGYENLIDQDGLIVGQTENGRVVARSFIHVDSYTGARFGIVGATTPNLPTISSPDQISVTATLTDTAAAVQAEIDRLQGAPYNINRIIFVSHLQGLSSDIAFMPLVSGIDLAVGGGGDELLVNQAISATVPISMQVLPGTDIERPGVIAGTYPTTATDQMGRTVYIVTGDGNYKYLGRLDVEFDTNGEVSNVMAEKSYPRRVIPNSAAATSLGLMDTVAPDPFLQNTVINPVQTCLTNLGNTTLAETEIPLDFSRDGVRSREDNGGNLVADAFLFTYDRLAAADPNLPERGGSTYVVAIQNGGGIRQNAGNTITGTVTARDTLDILPFDNRLTLVRDVTPTELKEIFEHSGLARSGADRDLVGSGGFLQVSGISVTYNISNTIGNYVVNLTLADGTPIVQNGQVVAGAPTISLVTNSFTAGGGDAFPVLPNKPQTSLREQNDALIFYEQSLREYLQSFPPMNGVPTIVATDPRYQPGGQGRSTILAELPVSEPVTLSLLHNNDGESGLLPITNTVDMQQVPVGGIAAFKSVVDREIAQATQAGNASLLVYAGDAFLASSTIQCSFPIDSNEPLYDAIGQSQVPYTAHIFGNHEFDYTPTFLKRFIDGFGGNQPFLSANLDFSGEADFASLIDADGLINNAPQDGRVIGRSMIVRDPTTNQLFGIVGATTTNLASVSSPRNVTVLDLPATVTAVQAEIDRLQAQGVNKIVLVSHLQDVQNDRSLIEQLRGVDLAVAGGGDDFLVNSNVDQALQLLPGQQASEIEGEYPLTVTDAANRTVYLVTSIDKYRFLGRLDVAFDANGEVTEVITANSYPRRVVTEGDAATALGVADAVMPDAALVTSVNEPVWACQQNLATPIARTEILLNVSRDGVRGGENNTGNLVADSFIDSYNRYAANSGLPAFSQQNPVVAIQNGGGIRQNAGDVLPRSGMVPGDLTRLDTIDVLPFNNFITVIQEVTPQQLLDVLGDVGTSGIYHVGNLRLEYVSAMVNGETRYQIDTITLVNFDGTTQLLVDNGQPVAGAPNITVVTNSFVAGREFAATAANQTNLQDGNGSEILYEQPLREYLLTFPMEAGLPTIQSDDARYQPGGEGRIIIDGATGRPTTVSLMVGDPTIAVSGTTLMTATVRNQSGTPMPNQSVVFRTTLGDFTEMMTGTTNSEGIVTRTLQAGAAPGLAFVWATSSGLIDFKSVLFIETGASSNLVGDPLFISVPANPTMPVSGTVPMSPSNKLGGTVIEVMTGTVNSRNLGSIIFQEIVSPTTSTALPTNNGNTQEAVGAYAIRLLDRNGALISGDLSPDFLTFNVLFPLSSAELTGTVRLQRYDTEAGQWTTDGIELVGTPMATGTAGIYRQVVRISHFSEFALAADRTGGTVNLLEAYLPIILR